MVVDRAAVLSKRRKRRLTAAAAVFLLAMPVLASCWPQGEKAWRVIDGDTLDLDGERIRLFGIDAPEITQALGQNARTALSALAANQGLSAECRKLGAQDVCRVRIGGKDIALELLRAGMAWWNPQHASLQTDQERADYQQAEFNAKIRRFGLWNAKNPVPPWQWRRF